MLKVSVMIFFINFLKVRTIKNIVQFITNLQKIILSENEYDSIGRLWFLHRNSPIIYLSR